MPPSSVPWVYQLLELQIVLILVTCIYPSCAEEDGFKELFKEHFDEIQARSVFGIYGRLYELNEDICPDIIPKELAKEIESYQSDVQSIVDATMTGPFKGRTFDELRQFTKHVGARPSGSVPLENGLDYIETKFKEFRYTNLEDQPVPVPFWQRGVAQGMLLTPNERVFEMKSYGFSVNTPDDGISGKVIIIKTLDKIESLSEIIEGKIVLFASKGSDDNRLSLFGVEEVAKFGAIGVLSQTPSWNVYTVGIYYGHDEKAAVKIPAAYISKEDAEYMQAMASLGLEMIAYMRIVDNQVGNTIKISKNLLGDFVGQSKPKEYVLCAAHSDSWDTGQGIQDDGFGVFMSLLIPVLIKTVGLNPARSIKTGIFTGEEIGLYGAKEYINTHADVIANFSAVIEPDWGITQASGLIVSGSKFVACVIRYIENLVEIAYDKYGNQTEFLLTKLYGTPTNAAGFTALERVPSVVLNGDGGKPSYMQLHHTDDDNMDFVSSTELDKGLALLASTVYVIADMKEMLPKVEQYVHKI